MPRKTIAYGVSFLVVAVAILVRIPLSPLLGEHVPFITLFPAVALAAWFGGRGPALLALAVSVVAVPFIVLEPRFTWVLNEVEYQAGLVLFLFISLSFIALFDSIRRVSREAAEQHERLRTTIASIGDGVIATDLEGRVTSMNGVAETLTGWRAAEAVGLPLESVFRIVNEQTQRTVENPVQKVLQLGQIVGLANHTILIARDGTERPVDDSAAPIRCKDGEIVGCVLVFRDVTERRKSEETARLLSSIVESSEDAIIGKDLAERTGPARHLVQQAVARVRRSVHGAGAGQRLDRERPP